MTRLMLSYSAAKALVRASLCYRRQGVGPPWASSVGKHSYQSDEVDVLVAFLMTVTKSTLGRSKLKGEFI